jgi:hypothetical protein
VAYLGNDLKVAYPTYVNIDDISGSFNGSTTSFALLVRGAAPVPLPLNSQQCLISVAGVLQRPDDTGAEGFRLSGGNIVFSSAPATGADFFGVILAGADYVNAGATYPDGSAAVPSITFDQDTDTGFYRSGSGVVSFSSNSVQAAILATTSLTAPSFIPTSSTVPTNGVYLPSANNVAISTNSQGRLFVNSSGNVGIGTTSPGGKLAVSDGTAYFQFDPVGGTANILRSLTGAGSREALQLDATQLVFANSGSERFRCDSSGRFLVGTSSARSDFFNATTFAPRFQVEGTDFSTSMLSVTCNATGANTNLVLARSRGTTNGAVTVVADGDTIGSIHFQGADGTDLVSAANIVAVVDGTPGANDMPGRLVFSTTADGASSPTERLRIASNGQLSAVVPGNATLYPAFFARAWVNFNGTGTPAVRASGNVSSITDAAVGAYGVNLSNAMPDTNYSVAATGINTGVAFALVSCQPSTTTQVEVGTFQVTAISTAADIANISVSVFR